MHGWEGEFEKRIKNTPVLSWFFRMTYGKVDGFIVLGDIFAKRLRELGIRHTTPVWIDTTVTEVPGEGIVESRVPKEGETRVLFISRILVEKGVLVAMDAVREVQRWCPECKISLTIAGDGPDLQEAKDYARRIGLENVRFPGYVRGREKIRLLCDSDVLLFPTHYGKGLPCVVLEAMANGLVVITRPVGGIPEVIEDGEHGFLLQSVDPEHYAEVLMRVAKDIKLIETISSNNRRAALRFEKTEVARRVLKIHEAVLARSPI